MTYCRQRHLPTNLNFWIRRISRVETSRTNLISTKWIQLKVNQSKSWSVFFWPPTDGTAARRTKAIQGRSAADFLGHPSGWRRLLMMMMMTKSISFSGGAHPHAHTDTHTHTKEPTKTHTRRVLIGCWDGEKGAIKVISRPIDRFFLFDCTFWWPSKKKLENNGRYDDVIHQLSFCSKANEAPNCLTLNTSVRI